MPELPEVETTRRGIEPHLVGQTISTLKIRQAKLRWPIPENLPKLIKNRHIESVERRAKYLLINTDVGAILVHLGMSGSLRILHKPQVAKLHEHVDLKLKAGHVLRYTDPRRFGCWLWQARDQLHPLLSKLGPEPLSETFDVEYLWRLSRNRKLPIKSFLMDQAVVVGVGNIYAAEALFVAGINPLRAAGGISKSRYRLLVDAVKSILTNAIGQGGTTLKDFIKPDGAPGYFAQKLMVYGRCGLPCLQCSKPLLGATIGQRASVYCRHCQN